MYPIIRLWSIADCMKMSVLRSEINNFCDIPSPEIPHTISLTREPNLRSISLIESDHGMYTFTFKNLLYQ